MESDEELLSRSVVDPLAFEPLVLRHADAVHSYLARRAPAAADDLLAEVWLAAFEARHRYDVLLGGARGWLFGIARNMLFSHYRRANRISDEPAPELVEDAWAAVDDRLDAAATGPDLRAALTALPEVDRDMLLLIAWEHLTPTEAAQVVGIPAGTARSRLHRARATMRERLSPIRQVPDGHTPPPLTPKGAH